ncbi:hypothetical protein Btru_065380 [Bulinus truncatus]|nr:hypothetical protein Btru_065380 [Bulinus truncatus]
MSNCQTFCNSVWRFAFNLTSSYNLDSDVFLPYDTLSFEPKPVTERPNYTEIALHKTKMAAWLVSNCDTSSKRHLYVKELQKHIDVDIFGRCGQNVACDDHKCLTPYKFYISFENSFCDDYITEKLFKMYAPDTHIIPIVRGGGRYRECLPTDTFINTADFRSVKDLAMFLQHLSSNTQIYAQYLANKDRYRRLPRVNFFCHVCQGVRRGDFEPKVYDMKKWMEEQCHGPTDLT